MPFCEANVTLRVVLTSVLIKMTDEGPTTTKGFLTTEIPALVEHADSTDHSDNKTSGQIQVRARLLRHLVSCVPAGWSMRLAGLRIKFDRPALVAYQHPKCTCDKRIASHPWSIGSMTWDRLLFRSS
jgi:hypothetical protein